MMIVFLEDIDILSVDICVQEKDKFIAETRASTDISIVLPYLNAIFPKANYNPHSVSIKFTHERVEFTLFGSSINLQKFKSRTELMELLDWAKDFINDIHASMAELVPLHTTRKIPPALTIYSMLPKTNCQKCKEKSCMAFAARLHKMELELSDCPLLSEAAYSANLTKLETAFGSCAG